MLSRRLSAAVALVLTAVVALAVGASPALAETHPLLFSFGSFANPNGVAIDQSSGDVYVADIGTNTIYKFDADGNPVDFSALHSNALTGGATPAGSFSFPSVYGTPATIAIDNSTNPSDPSAGDLYVMDAGHNVIDKFNSKGEYLDQIINPSGDELLGLGVDASGTLRVDIIDINQPTWVLVDEFNDSSASSLVAEQVNEIPATKESGIPSGPEADGFAVGPTGDDYLLWGGSCNCTAKLGPQLTGFGQLDSPGAGDVAIAADPVTGHVYVDDQSSVTEWDTGAMNGSKLLERSFEYPGVGTLVSSFGSLWLSGVSGQGGIAVDGASGDIYVSNPADGKVYVFGSDAPAVSAGMPVNVTMESATLSGAVDPRGAAVTSCRFEYGVANEYGQGPYEHTVACTPETAAIGAGTVPVAVSVQIGGLRPGLLYRFRLVAGNASGSGESSGLIATRGAGFGVKSFEVSFLNEDGSPDTQAGSHPYEVVNNVEYNSHYVHFESNADSRYILEPDGVLKNLAVDLPPGLVGDPDATTKKCTPDELLSGESHIYETLTCPIESVVGHLVLAWSHQVAGGSLNSNSGSITWCPLGVYLCSSASITWALACTSTTGCSPAAIIPCRQRSPTLRRPRRCSRAD